MPEDICSNNNEEDQSQTNEDNNDVEAVVSIISDIYRREKTIPDNHKKKGEEELKAKAEPGTILTRRLSAATIQEKGLVLSFPHPLLDGFKRIICEKQLRILGYQKPCKRLFTAMTWNNPYLIEELVLQGHDVDVKDDTNGFTPLHIAASHNQAECVQVLLNLQANVNAIAVTGITPLLMAVASKSLKCIEILKQAGGSYTAPRKPISGYRSVLDAPTLILSSSSSRRAGGGTRQASNDLLLPVALVKAKAMGRAHRYHGQY